VYRTTGIAKLRRGGPPPRPFDYFDADDIDKKAKNTRKKPPVKNNIFNRGKGIVSNLYNRASPYVKKALPYAQNIKKLKPFMKPAGAVAGIAALPVIGQNPELNPFLDRQPFQIKPKALGSPLLGRENEEETLRRYVEGRDGYEPRIVAGGLRRGVNTFLDYLSPDIIFGKDSNLAGAFPGLGKEFLTGEYQNPNLLRGGLDSREAFEETIDNAKDQLGLGLAGRFANLFKTTRAGEITTGQKVSRWLDSNKDKLYAMSTKDVDSAKVFIETLQSPEGVKNLMLAEDPDTYYEIFADEERPPKAPEDESLPPPGLTDEQKKALEDAQALRDANKEIVRSQAIRGKNISPEIEDKALTAGMYGGSPEDTAFAFLEDAEVTRVLEEEKQRKFDLEKAKAVGSGYNKTQAARKFNSDLDFYIYEPTSPNAVDSMGNKLNEKMTDSEFGRVSGIVSQGLRKHQEIDQYFDDMIQSVENNNLTGLGSILGKYTARGINALTGLDMMSDLEQYQSVAKAIQAYFTAQILQESGRTISDGDRQRVEDLFANISWKNLGQPRQVLLEKINRARGIISQSQADLVADFNMLEIYNPNQYRAFMKNQEKIDQDLNEEEAQELETRKQQIG
tara:strand:- start:3905 stop:5764 length:1860 start_codon:yes stop_codon:yes gene_type:complete